MAKEKKDSKKVTNLKIERAGNVFKAGWNNPVSYTSLKCKFRKKVDGKWEDWPKSWTSLSNSATTAEKTISLSSYYPNSSSKLENVEVAIHSLQADTNKINYTGVNEYAYFDIKLPNKVNITPESGATNTKFNYSIAAENNLHGVYQQTNYKTGSAHDWGTKDPKDFTGWGDLQTNTTASGTITVEGGIASVANGGSITYMIRMNASGPAGTNSLVNEKMLYAKPLQANNISLVSCPIVSGQFQVCVDWDRVATDAYPVYEHKVQYCIGKPSNTSLDPPSNASWQDADLAGMTFVPEDQSKVRQRATFLTPQWENEVVNGVYVGEDCMWVRVVQRQLEGLDTPSEAQRILEFTRPPKPIIESISYDAVSHALSVSVDNNCDGITPTTTLYYGRQAATVPANGTYTTTYELGIGEWGLVAVNTYGGKTSEQAVETFIPALSANTPTPYYPTGVKAVEGTAAGSAVVSWTNVMRGVTGAEIQKSTNKSTWTDAGEVEGEVTSYTVTGLSTGSTYYFRVRTENGKGTSGWSTSIGELTLKANVPPAPTLTLAREGLDNIKVSWNWGDWASAEEIELLWSQNTQAYKLSSSNWESVSRGGHTGADDFIIGGLEVSKKPWYVWARFVSSETVSGSSEKHITLGLTPSAPTINSFTRANTSVDGKTSATLKWSHSWNDAQKTIVTWDTDPDAWNTTKGPANSAEVDASKKQVIIADLDLGKKWYAKVRLEYNDEFYSESNGVKELNLITKPYTPTVSVSPVAIAQSDKVTVSWAYDNEDGSEQRDAVVKIYRLTNGTYNKVKSVSVGNETAVSVYANNLTAGTYYATVKVTSNNGKASDESTKSSFTVVSRPIAVIASTSLVSGKLKSLPLTMTVTGGDDVLVYIERAESMTVPLMKPDETEYHGYAGELVAKVESNSSSISIGQSDLRSSLDQDNKYRITAIVTNNIGTDSKPVTLDFTVDWTAKAVMPTADYETDDENKIVKITPTAGTGTPEDAFFEIYRLSADKPELILSSSEWDEPFVDPYPSFGENSGHRIVCKTAEGNYIDANGQLAWLDLEAEDFVSDAVVIDFDGGQINFIYNVDVSHSWDKDFTETKYLGGSVQGDWNPAVSRNATIGAVMVTLVDSAKIETMRKLAAYTGICHVRTPDGSSFAADVQVSEKWSQDSAHKIAEFSLKITRVDPEGFDAIYLTDWEAEE